MDQTELIQIINSQIDTGFSVDMPTQELQGKLTAFINDLIQNDFQKLVFILYKVDVDENRLKRILKEQTGKDAAAIIADLILERQIQKIATRKLYKS
jgi:hypothetical protein